jgi:hypothetical protein
MSRFLFAILMLLTLGLSIGSSQTTTPAPPAEDRGTFLGILFSAVPDLLYDQLPQLPRNTGVVVAHVLPDSPAGQMGMRHNDVILRYDEEKVRDCEHFARLIHDDRPGRKVRLTFLRGGREMSALVTLVKGPVLRIAQKDAVETPDEEPRGSAKANPNEEVTVSATPLGNNTLKLTVEYYDDQTGKLHSVPCSGSPDEIDSQIQKLPERVQELAKVALRRLRRLEVQRQSNTSRIP